MLSLKLFRVPTGLIALFATIVCLSALAPAETRAAATSERFGQIPVSKYFLFNNTWGHESSPGGWSSIWNSNSASPLWWGTAYDWPAGSNPNGVKAYLSVVSGWHWGTWSQNSGLPVRIWDNKTVRTTGNFSLTNPGVQNVAYDCWFHTMSNPSWQSNPTDELMIWVSTHGGAGPAGTYQGDAWLAGANWRVYKGWIDAGNGVGWNVYSYVRTSNTSSWDFNVRDFVNHVVYVKAWMSNAKFLTSVQFGTEVFRTNGSGSMNVGNYRVDVY